VVLVAAGASLRVDDLPGATAAHFSIQTDIGAKHAWSQVA